MTPKDQIGPISERIDMVDALRGLAVCGILIGNMQWFSGYGMMPPVLAEQAPLLDKIVHFLVHFLVEGKFYSIFSFLFGFGFALQIARAEARGDLSASVFKRRLFWLLAIGVAHAYLLWAGDILSVYALMGFMLLLFRRKPDRSLLTWAAVLIAVPVFTYLLMYALFVAFVPEDALTSFQASRIEMWNENVRAVTEGSYFQIVSDFNLKYVAGRYAGLIFQMRLPKILAMFLLGLYAYRRGVFQGPAGNRVFIRKVMVYGLTAGLLGNAVFAAFAKSEADLPPSLSGLAGVIAYAFAVPALALGTAALVANLWQSGALRPVLARLAPAGRMALTNYLLQTVICVTLFYGYGFGLFGRFGAATATATALGIFASQIALSGLWLRYFAYGPAEWLWRQLTYGRRLPLTRSVHVRVPGS